MNSQLHPDAVDCHLHAGVERRETFEEVFEYLAREGRKVVGLVDHAEVYLKRPPGWVAMSLAEAAQCTERADVGGSYVFHGHDTLIAAACGKMSTGVY